MRSFLCIFIMKCYLDFYGEMLSLNFLVKLYLSCEMLSLNFLVKCLLSFLAFLKRVEHATSRQQIVSSSVFQLTPFKPYLLCTEL